ncbi:hypothetical protein RN001_002329 [Aquatica leii]|uniref:Diphthine--ammonia ligase n=1 Tax=Aquatica leii TaxID=1421715 RepID=A0AAN7PH38_9COLE|nr:hypothetical protein RN001_002329 [Aquatica leii]
MKVVALISGGKDSCYNVMQCIAAGHEVVALANLKPYNETEIDSYMYQSVGHEAIEFMATAMDLPLFRKEITGSSTNLNINYSPTKNDEVEDLFELLQKVKLELSVEAVSVGAILSDYQRSRVENVCSRLNLVALAYLWRRDQSELLQEMIKSEIDAIIVKVAALGLDPSRHLGRSLRLVEPHLLAMHEKYGLNVCGEGGEYETLVLDCPLYSSRIVIEESEVILHSNDLIAPVGFLKLNNLKLETKLPQISLSDRLSSITIKDSDRYITDCGEDSIEINCEDTPDTSYNIQDIREFRHEYFGYEFTCSKSKDGWLWIGGLCGNSSDCEHALKEALEKLKSCLTANGHRLEDVVSVVMFISSMSKFVELNRLYVEVLKHVNPPSRACVEVPLPKDCPVILEVLSWSNLGSEVKGDMYLERCTMHVQSISHWAPANIGPYSQAVRIGDIIHVAGQIGLVPGSMHIVQGGIASQCQVAIRHIGRIINAIDNNVNLRHVVQATCYVNNKDLIDIARKFWEAKTNSAIVNYVVVTTLPKNALVEWHVWAHRYNSSFEFEETGKCINICSVSIYRRCNYETNVSAIVSHVDSPLDLKLELSIELYTDVFNYILRKLQSGLEDLETSICNLKIFYNVQKEIVIKDIIDVLNELRENNSIVYVLVPAVDLYSEHTLLSISGVRLP